MDGGFRICCHLESKPITGGTVAKPSHLNHNFSAQPAARIPAGTVNWNILCQSHL